jgi:hypothetical protein
VQHKHRLPAVQARTPVVGAATPEVCAVSLAQNMLDRIALTHLASGVSSRAAAALQPWARCVSRLGSAGQSASPRAAAGAPPAGAAAQTRPHSNHPLQRSFAWTAGKPNIAKAVAYLDYIVNYQLRGHFLPLDLWCGAPLAT